MREYKFTQNIIVPNITKMTGVLPFETDVLVVTNSGYATGFEIKVSKSDLKADFKKRQHVQVNNLFENKSGFEKFYGKFKYFYYAVPPNLVDDCLDMLPDYFGIYCIENNKLKLVRPSKELFKHKWSESNIRNLLRLGTMRIYSLKKRLAKFEK